MGEGVGGSKCYSCYSCEVFSVKDFYRILVLVSIKMCELILTTCFTNIFFIRSILFSFPYGGGGGNFQNAASVCVFNQRFLQAPGCDFHKKMFGLILTKVIEN